MKRFESLTLSLGSASAPSQASAEASTRCNGKLKATRFHNCQLKDADFAEADLSAATFDGCDLAGAIFDRSNLEKADFRTARNYRIDPENNRLKKAKFSPLGLAGLLGKYDVVIG